MDNPQFKPNLSVKEGLDHLAQRLDPIIGRTLASHLGGAPWTAVLAVLDQKKGYAPKQYATTDLQAQLRMLTERLGSLGYPFDDVTRTVSTLGGELRIVRNNLAHTHTFSVIEAFRANDFAVRLLEHFNDADGLAEAGRIRLEALAALAAHEGVSEQAAAAAQHEPAPTAEESPASVDTEPTDAQAEIDAAEDSPVSPDPIVMHQTPGLIGDCRLSYEPWTVVPVGAVAVLDDLPKKAAKQLVRATAVEIAAVEGPIHLGRLVQLIGQSFGLQRVRSAREKKLAYQVRQCGLFIDDDKFVWPNEIEPGSWIQFRPNDSSATRTFTDISPIEIANAARFIRERQPELSSTEFEVAILQTFGRRRRTRQLTAHLKKALALLDQ